MNNSNYKGTIIYLIESVETNHPLLSKLNHQLDYIQIVLRDMYSIVNNYRQLKLECLLETETVVGF